MREVLYEESINPSNYNARKIASGVFGALKIVNALIAIVYLFLSIFYLDSSIFKMLFFVAFAVVFFLLERGVFYCVDCAFISGSTRLVKVIGYKKRKMIISFEYNQVEQVGKIGSESFDKIYSDKNVKKIAASPNKYADGSFYVYLKKDGINYLVILDCKEDYLKNLVAFTGRRVIEKDYK